MDFDIVPFAVAMAATLRLFLLTSKRRESGTAILMFHLPGVSLKYNLLPLDAITFSYDDDTPRPCCVEKKLITPS